VLRDGRDNTVCRVTTCTKVQCHSVGYVVSYACCPVRLSVAHNRIESLKCNRQFFIGDNYTHQEFTMTDKTSLKAIDEANHGKTKRPRASADAGTNTVPFRGFINHTPTEEEKEDFRRWMANEGLFDEVMGALLEAGYTIKLGYNNKDSAYSASISRWFARYPDAGLVFTAYSTNYVRSLAKVAWFAGRHCDYDMSGMVLDKRSVDEW